MNVFQAIVLGIVEGITEFLPISSTAHLIITSQLLQIPQTEFLKLFEVVIQSGAILAVIFLYFHYILKHRNILVKIIASFIPTAFIGLVLHDTIKNVFFESNVLIVGSLVFAGLLFIIIEWLVSKKKLSLEKKVEDISLTHAILVGIAQASAIVPGISRAGAVILALMLLKYKRSDAAIYSFLLAVPTIIGAGALDLVKSDSSLFTVQNNGLLTVGFVTSFVIAYFSVKWLISYLQRNTLTPFGIYRIALAIIVLLLFS